MRYFVTLDQEFLGETLDTIPPTDTLTPCMDARPPRRMTPQLRSVIIRDANRGLCRRDIAWNRDVHVSVVNQVLRDAAEAGQLREKEAKPDTSAKGTAIRMVLEGASIESVLSSFMYDVSLEELQRALQERNNGKRT